MPDMQQHTVEAITGVAQKTAVVVGSGTAVFAGITVEVWGIIVGVAIATVSLVIQVWMNWHFNSKRLEIERERLERESLVSDGRG